MNESVVRDIADLERNVDEAFTRLSGARSLLQFWRGRALEYEAAVAQGKHNRAAAATYAMEAVTRAQSVLAICAEQYVVACDALRERREDLRERQRVVAEDETVIAQTTRSLH